MESNGIEVPPQSVNAASSPMRTLVEFVVGRWAARVALVALGAWTLVECVDIVRAVATGSADALDFAATAAVLLGSALISSIAGFAFAAIAGGALAYLQMSPVHAVQTMALCSIAMQLYAVWRIRDSIRWRALVPMLAAGIVMLPFGVWLLLHVDGTAYSIGLGLFVTAYGAYVVMKGKARVLSLGPWHEAAAGALGGLAGGLAGFPGAFVTILCSLRGWDKVQQRAVYQPYILLMQVGAIACLHWQAPVQKLATHDFAFIPFALLGAIGGLALFERMTNKQFQVALSVLLLVSGVGLLVRAV